MHRYIIKRILLMIPTLLGVAIITFVLLRMVPGDIVVLKLAGDGGRVDEAVLQAERARLGLDRPMLEQFATWLLGAIHLDFGLSMWTLGAIAALKQDTWIDYAIRLFSIAGLVTVIGLEFAFLLGGLLVTGPLARPARW
jgi:peptide/nickel transport system permease protein